MIDYEQEPAGEEGERISGKAHFNPFRTTTHRGLLEAAQRATGEAFALQAGRQRAPRKAAVEAWEAISLALFSNLAHRHCLFGNAPSIIVPLRKETKAPARYTRGGFRQLPQVVEWLVNVGWLSLTKGTRKRGTASTVQMTPKLAPWAAEVALGDFNILDEEETIILSKTQWKLDGSGLRKRSDRVDYADTGHTRKLRAQVAEVNKWLSTADIAFTASGLGVDHGDKRMRRHFSLSRGKDSAKGFKWDRGGRLYGGFWQNLKSEHRKHIRIEGEPIADLDYSAMFIRLALARVDHALAEDADPYQLEGIDREVAKQAINALLNTQGNKMPEKLREALPGISLRELKAIIASNLPQLEPLFGTGVGLDLMHTESQILLGVIEALVEEQIVGLPMHDGVMVPESKASKAAKLMEAVAVQRTGLRFPVKRKGID